MRLLGTTYNYAYEWDVVGGAPKISTCSRPSKYLLCWLRPVWYKRAHVPLDAAYRSTLLPGVFGGCVLARSYIIRNVPPSPWTTAPSPLSCSSTPSRQQTLSDPVAVMSSSRLLSLCDVHLG